jgi:hypothetical protein
MSLEYRDPPEPPKKQSNTEFSVEWGGDTCSGDIVNRIDLAS